MPIFEFLCEKCGYEFEDIYPADATAPQCPNCGAQTQRKISAPSPLKTGAFPYKPKGVHPLGQNMGCGMANSCSACSRQDACGEQ